MKKTLFAISFSTLMLASSAAFAEQPALNISQRMHPHLAAAQKHSSQAHYRIRLAQRANRNQLNGHAQKAKELLVEANHELKLAAKAANQNRRHM